MPVAGRLAVAGRLLDALPDTPAAVRPVVASLTAGLPPRRAADRIRQLQRFTEGCATLDAVAAAADAGPVRCPACRAKRTHRTLARHLWHRHGLLLLDGRAVEPRLVLDPVVTAAAGGDPAAVDRAFADTAAFYPAATAPQVLQAVAARGAADPAAVDRLVSLAAAAGCGLCPLCLTAVPDPVAAVPPPADWAAGRVAADGFAVTVRDGPGGRVETVSVPHGPDVVTTPPGAGRPPRLVASVVALAVVAVGGLAAAVVPRPAANPLVVGLAGAALGWAAYAVARSVAKRPPDADQEALAAAWDALVPGVGRSPAALRFLARVCRLSIGVGDPDARAGRVAALVESAAVLADKSPAHTLLFASAAVLQAADGAARGRERVAAYLAVFAGVWRGETSLGYADAAAELVLAEGLLPPGGAARLGVLVVAQAFAAGLAPADLRLVGRFAPRLGALLDPAGGETLARLYVVYRRPPGGTSTTVFDLAAADPDAARVRLAAQPGLLLDLRIPGAEAFGPVGLTDAGLTVGGSTVGDPDAVLDVRPGDGVTRLHVGSARLLTRKPVGPGVAAALQKWVTYYATMPPPAAGPPHPRAVALLRRLAVACPLCGGVAVHRAGRVGTPFDAIAPASNR